MKLFPKKWARGNVHPAYGCLECKRRPMDSSEGVRGWTCGYNGGQVLCPQHRGGLLGDLRRWWRAVVHGVQP